MQARCYLSSSDQPMQTATAEMSLIGRVSQSTKFRVRGWGVQVSTSARKYYVADGIRIIQRNIFNVYLNRSY